MNSYKYIKLYSAIPNKIKDNRHYGIHEYDYIQNYLAKHNYFIDKDIDDELEKVALLITAFLSHWGMFRGSSNLKNTNTVFFMDLCKELLGPNGGLEYFIKTPLNKIEQSHKATISTSIENIQFFLKEITVSPTGTLVSKIILGLTGNIPAYDRYFNVGLKKLSRDGSFDGPLNFGANSIISLSNWYNTQKWPELRNNYDKRRKLSAARLADMAIFAYGYKYEK